MAKYVDQNGLDRFYDNIADRPVQAFDTVAAMQAATYLEAGMTCHTNGFHTAGDGGAAYYTVSTSGTANGMDVLACAGGLYATLVVTEPCVTPEQFGAWGDGVKDDSAMFDAMIPFAIANDCMVQLGSKTYNLKTMATTTFTSMVGDGATLVFDSQLFTYGDRLILKGVNIQHAYAETSANIVVGAFMRPSSTSSFVNVENVTFDCVNSSDTKRGKIFLRCIAEDVNVRNVQTSGAIRGVVVNNDASIEVNRIALSDIVVANAQCAIDIEGYTSSADYSGYVYNVSIDHISLVNTSAQQSNYTQVVGSDGIIINNAKNVKISNVYCDYVIERALYLVNVSGVTIDGVTSIHGEGVKVVGTNLAELGSSGIIYSTDVTISNIMVVDAANRCCMTFYECQNVTCDGITFFNSITTAYYGIALTGHLDNIRIENVTGQNAGRGLFWLYEIEAKETAITNVTIKGVRYDVPVNTGGYSAIRVEGLESNFVTGLVIDDAIFNATKAKYRAASPCIGLISLAHATTVRISNSECNDIKTLGTGIVIDSSCANVSVYGEMHSVPGGNAPGMVDFTATASDVTILTEYTRNRYVARNRVQMPNGTTGVVSQRIGTIEFGAILAKQITQVLLPATVTMFTIEIVGSGGYYRGYCNAGTLTVVESTGQFGDSTLTVTRDSTNGLTISSTIINYPISGRISYYV